MKKSIVVAACFVSFSFARPARAQVIVRPWGYHPWVYRPWVAAPVAPVVPVYRPWAYYHPYVYHPWFHRPVYRRW